jgi:hypothetical protein
VQLTEELAEQTFCATGAAFRELRAALMGRLGEEAFRGVLAGLPPAAREAATTDDDAAFFDEPLWVDTLHAAIAVGGLELAREVGRLRGVAVLATEREVFTEDPIRFLKIGSSLFYRDRHNYGAAALELTQRKAILRFMASPHQTLKRGDAPNAAPHVVLGFLDYVTSELAGAPQTARYTGHVLRADKRFGKPIYNQHYEYELEAAA